MIVPIISPGVRGVDLSDSPFNLRDRRVRHALNVEFTNYCIKNRPGFFYENMGICGKFQGADVFRPGSGLSALSTAPRNAFVISSVDGQLYSTATDNNGVHCCPVLIEETGDPCAPASNIIGEVNIYTAEDYVVVQGPGRQTAWWDGKAGTFTLSPGMTTIEASHVDEKECTSSHDTFLWDQHKNFLVNGATLGVYAHGRVHQVVGRFIYVGDPVNKRGYLKTDDVLLMEEQRLPSFGPPLNISGAMGTVRALVVTPRYGGNASAYGQGELVAYCDGGIVAFNTYLPGRRRKINGTGEILTEGWQEKRMVDPVAGVVTAVGRYGACALPRDQLLRSKFGVHILSQLTGVEYINDEPTHTFSYPVDPLLNMDSPELLAGSAVGYWMGGNRFVVTTMMRDGCSQSVQPVGQGFVVYNKAFTKTQDQTPLTAWEGLWRPDERIVNCIHRFIGIGTDPDSTAYGFLASNEDNQLYYVGFRKGLDYDLANGREWKIPWMVETGRYYTGATQGVLSNGVLDFTLKDHDSFILVQFRTDKSQEWKNWVLINPDMLGTEVSAWDALCGLKATHPLGTPPDDYKEANWFQFRLRGIGPFELHSFTVDIVSGQSNVTDTVQTTVPLTDPIEVKP